MEVDLARIGDCHQDGRCATEDSVSGRWIRCRFCDALGMRSVVSQMRRRCHVADGNTTVDCRGTVCHQDARIVANICVGTCVARGARPIVTCHCTEALDCALCRRRKLAGLFSDALVIPDAVTATSAQHMSAHRSTMTGICRGDGKCATTRRSTRHGQPRWVL
jgi:hypothetical protein